MPVKKSTAAPKAAPKKAATAAKSTVKDTPRLEDFINEVKAKAFDIYLRRVEKGEPGDEIGDWSYAEKEIKTKYGIK
ncbi:MAG: hypothetical protein JNL74_01725 [Fibrobacteres bacterium]|nr:hypothetical protein [Fibrobacterota bacterium]